MARSSARIAIAWCGQQDLRCLALGGEPWAESCHATSDCPAPLISHSEGSDPEPAVTASTHPPSRLPVEEQLPGLSLPRPVASPLPGVLQPLHLPACSQGSS